MPDDDTARDGSPTASIVIPAYNAGLHIHATLESILAQDHDSFEVIVVNDGSTDDTIDVVNSFDDPRVRLINISHSGGPSTPRNVGIGSSDSEFVFLFDSDDLMLPGKLRLSIQAFEQAPSAGILFTNFQQIDESGNLINHDFLAEYETLHHLAGRNLTPANKLIAATDLLKGLSKANFIGTSSVALRRMTIDAVGQFNERLKNADDFNYWIRVSTRFDGIFLNKALHQYRVHPASISRSRPLRALENATRLYEIHSADSQFPDWFRAESKSKYRLHAVDLAKTLLTENQPRDARSIAVKLLRKYPLQFTAYGLVLLSMLPARLRSGFILLWRRVQLRARQTK